MVKTALILEESARANLRRFQEDGLLWLVNTALLHPRGCALALHKDEAGRPVGLSLVGDFDEPWVMSQHDDPEREQDVARLHAYLDAEAVREADWSPKLRASAELEAWLAAAAERSAASAADEPPFSLE